MSNSFSSLENIILLFNNLVNSNISTLPLKHISKLLNDLTKLLNDSDYYDMEIRIGSEDEVKTFKVHSAILRARSPYFEVALSNNWTKKSEDGSIILFEKGNISPKVFEVLLM